MRILLDTNVLLRISDPNHAHHRPATAAVDALNANGDELRTVPQNLYEYWVVATRPIADNDTDEGRERILADYRAIVAETVARLPALFGRLPRAAVAVEPVPAFREAGAAGAYYWPPPFDGSKPGTFFVNLRSVADVKRFAMRTLAFHEAVPGHHLQIALSFEMQGVPFFRRVVPFTAFVEGWALYAERLAAEQGFHPTPLDLIAWFQGLEQLENTLMLAAFDAGAIVGHAEFDPIAQVACGDLHSSGVDLMMVLARIVQQVAEDRF